jgi:tetratricopeptide (TPR) repeat protein
VAVSPDGRWVAAGGWKEQGIQVWDLAQRRLERVLPHSASQTATAFWVCFSSDSRRLVSAAVSDDSCGYLTYLVGSWEREATRSAEFGTPARAAFSSDSGLMALSLSPNQILITEPASGREWMRLSGRHYAWPAALSGDGSELIAASGVQPMAWWNLRRLDKQLRELGLSWDSANGATDESRDSRFDSPIDPSGPDTWSDTALAETRVSVQVDQGDFPQRIVAQEKAKTGAEQLRLARTLVLAQSWVSARSAFERALDATPGDPRIQNDLAWLLANCPDLHLRDAPRSFLLATQAVKSQPNNVTYRNTLGVAHYRIGDYRAAITELTKTEELAPDRWFAHNAIFIAMSHWQLGEHETARDWFGRAVQWLEKNSPTDNELRRFRAEAEEFISEP